MTTLDGIITRVRQQAMGYAKDQPAVGELSADMTETDTTFVTDPASVTALSRGLVEIDDEMILIKSYDRNSGTIQVMGGLNGRGAEGTIPAAHSAHSLVTASPRFPRVRVKEIVNDVITSLYPQLCVFATTEITNTAVVYEYEMPADALDVWAVANSTIGPTKVWTQGANFRFNPTADTSAFPTGKSVQLFDAVTPGQTMLVKYAKAPLPLALGADDFAAVTGLPERCVDLVVYGTCARLLPAYEAARLQQSAVEATERAALVPPTSAVKTAQYYQAMYQQRLEEERMRMFQENPQPVYYGS